MKTTSSTGVVKRMREIRDQIGVEIMDMTFEERKSYYAEKAAKFRADREKREKLSLLYN